MIRTALFLVILLPACAETQSGRAFNVRPAPVVVPIVIAPNTADERSHDLASALDKSLGQQETVDQQDQQLVSGAAVAARPRVRRDDESDPVAAQQ